MASILDPEFQAAARWAGALVFTDATGNERCGLTGVLLSACSCADSLAYGVFPSPDYKGYPTFDWSEDDPKPTWPKGIRPPALTAGSSS